MDLEKLDYTEKDIKDMAINAAYLRDQLKGQNPRAFDEVESRCADLEKISPEFAVELKRKSQAQKLKFKKTQNPACFAQLITDLEELYGRAFKLMIENLRSISKAKNQKSTAESAKNAMGFKPIANTMEEPTHDMSVQKSFVEAKTEATAQQEKNRGGFFGRKKAEATVERISSSDLEALQGEKEDDKNQSMVDEAAVRARMEAYDRSVKARAQQNSKNQATMSQVGMGMEFGKRKN